MADPSIVKEWLDKAAEDFRFAEPNNSLLALLTGAIISTAKSTFKEEYPCKQQQNFPKTLSP